jgi:ferredoxin
MSRDITIFVTDRQGQTHELIAPTDMNLNAMEVCRMFELPVKGECGGMAMCATCQVYVESEHLLPSPGDAELDMLDQAFFVQPNSRLGCQLHISEALDGLRLRLAPEND